MNTQGDFECLCTNGWAGQTCNEDFDECAADLCPAGTICKSTKQSFTCECPARGCNNLDETLYNEKLSSTFGFQDDSLDAGSGDVEEVVEEAEEAVEDIEEVDELNATESNEVDDYQSYDEVTDSNVVSDEMMIEDNDAGDEYVNIDDNSEEKSEYNDTTESTYEY
jgi:hypothetical protein